MTFRKPRRAQFAKQSHRYGRGHVLEHIEDVQNCHCPDSVAKEAQVLDVATGGGHTGLYLASLGHDVTLADIAQPMLDRALKVAAERGLTVQTRQHAAEAIPLPRRAI